MVKKLKGLIREEEGQGMTEYGLVLGIVAVGVVGILATLQDEILSMFTEIKDAVVNRNDTTSS